MTDDRITSYNGYLEINFDCKSGDSKLVRPLTAEGITFKAAITPLDFGRITEVANIQILIQASPIDRADFTDDGWFAFAHVDTVLVPCRSTRNYVTKKYRELFYEWQGFLSSTISVNNHLSAAELLDEETGYISDNKLKVKVYIRHVVAFRVLGSLSFRRLEPLRPRRYAEDFFRSLYNKKDYSDGSFVIGDNTIPIHTILLIARNIDVFGPMFQSPEFKKTKKMDVSHLGFSPSALMSILRWIYRCELVIDQKARLAPQVYKIAQTWKILPIIRTCHVFVKENNVWVFLNLSRIFDDYQLKKICLSVINKGNNKLLECPHFVRYLEMADIKFLVSSNPRFATFNFLLAILKLTVLRMDQEKDAKSVCQKLIEPFLGNSKADSLSKDELKELQAFANANSLEIDFIGSHA